MKRLFLFSSVALALFSATVASAAGNGQLDPSFNTSGMADTAFDIGGSLNDDVYAQVVGHGGATFLLGNASVDSNPNQYVLSIAKFQHDGKLDPTFGDGGRAILPLSGGDLVPGLVDGAISASGDLVIAANVVEVMGKSFARVCRLGKTGKLDAAFGEPATPGCITVRSPGPSADDSSEVESIMIRPDGAIVLGGMFIGPFNAPIPGFAALQSDGKIDESFGSDGFTTFMLPNLDHVYQIESTPDGGILALLPYRDDPAPERIALLKIDAESGQPFGNFGDEGYVQVELAPSDAHQRANAFDIASDGAIFLAGEIIGPLPGKFHNIVVKLDPKGSPNSQFGTNGVVKFDDSAELDRSIMDVESVGSGVVAVGGWEGRRPPTRWGALKLDGKGKLDPAFGDLGSVILPLFKKAYHADLQGNRVVMSAGTTGTQDSGDHDFHIARVDHGLTKTHFVNPSAGANGSISPSTLINVLDSKVVEFQVVPKTGFRIASVTGCGKGELIGKRYRTGPVVNSCLVKATFEPIPFSP